MEKEKADKSRPSLLPTYSGVSNKRTGTLINFQKKCTRYALIRGQYANFLCTNENSLFSTGIFNFTEFVSRYA